MKTKLNISFYVFYMGYFIHQTSGQRQVTHQGYEAPHSEKRPFHGDNAILATINELQNEMKNLFGKLGIIEAKIDTTTKEVSGVKSSIVDMKTEFEKIVPIIKKITPKIEKFDNITGNIEGVLTNMVTMETKIANTTAILNSTESNIANLLMKIDDVNWRLNNVDSKTTTIAGATRNVEMKFQKMEPMINDLVVIVGNVEIKVDDIDTNLRNNISAKMKVMDAKVENITANVGRINSFLFNLQQKIIDSKMEIGSNSTTGVQKVTSVGKKTQKLESEVSGIRLNMTRAGERLNNSVTTDLGVDNKSPRNENNDTNTLQPELNVSTSTPQHHISEKIVDLFSDVTLNREWHESIFNGNHNYGVRFVVFGGEGDPPIYLRGVGFKGRPSQATEEIKMEIKVKQLYGSVLCEMETSYTAEANKIKMIDLNQSVKILPKKLYWVDVYPVVGGMAWWKNAKKDIVLYNKGDGFSRQIRLTLSSSYNIVYSLKFSLSE